MSSIKIIKILNKKKFNLEHFTTCPYIDILFFVPFLETYLYSLFKFNECVFWTWNLIKAIKKKFLSFILGYTSPFRLF